MDQLVYVVRANWYRFSKKCYLYAASDSVPDPWHFCVDPDPRIHDSDECIRIRTLLFSSLNFKTPTKTNFKISFSAYYFLKVHLHHFFEIKSPKEVTKQYESMFFFLFLLDDSRIRIRIWIHNCDKWIRIREAQKHVDPDPEHWWHVSKQNSIKHLSANVTQKRLDKIVRNGEPSGGKNWRD